jgi:Bacterial regulatory proteins, gntR family
VSAVETTTAAVMPELRWPLQPLLDACGLRPEALARRVGASGSAVRAALRVGMNDLQADAWAIRLGTHPLIVWGWAWIEDADRAEGRPAPVRLAAALRGRIEDGTLVPGSPVPTVAAVAGEWGVGTKTAADAIAELRRQGLVIGGGRGRPNIVAPTLAGRPARCAVCAAAIAPGEEHYPHRPHCRLAAHGLCDCGEAAHPECCPSCAAGAS